MDVRAERFRLAALLEDIQATFRPLTAEKGLDFEVRVEGSAPDELVTDRQRLRQVLGNLVSNAVKFTERGQVTLRVAGDGDGRDAGDGRVDGPADGAVVVFSVTDTGIGIAPENLAVIFGAFQQGDGTLSRRYGGTGLGLSIASEVSALLGGSISATSELGHGSTFTLTVPTALPAFPASLPEPGSLFPARALPGLGDALAGGGPLADLNRMGAAGADVVDHLRAVTSRATAMAATAADEAGRPSAGRASAGRASAEGRGAGGPRRRTRAAPPAGLGSATGLAPRARRGVLTCPDPRTGRSWCSSRRAAGC